MTQQITGSGGGCFRKGAQVQLENGQTVAIESLKAGDIVLGFDEQGVVRKQTVEKLHVHEDAQPIWKVSFWRGNTFITPNHWVLNQYNAFVEIGRMALEDALVDALGHLRPITGFEHVADEPVYNLTVVPDHTFIVDGIRVHNGGHRERFPEVGITGAGGSPSGKGGGGRTPVEDPDSLRSKAVVSVIDVIGEGEIKGLVDGARGIYINGTPLQNEDLSYNFTGVSWDYRGGTQEQSAMGGYNTVEAPVSVGQEIKVGFPYTFTVNDSETDELKVIMSFPSLMSQDSSTGDIRGTEVKYQYQWSIDGGAYGDIGDPITVRGKSRSRYQRVDVIKLPKPFTSINIRVIRITADSDSATLQNESYLDSFVKVINQKLRYPNTALVGVTIDSEQFTSIPSRAYLIEGIKIRVPSNYDPVLRVYTGTWNGTFKVEYSNNPAWVLYDLLTSERYGLGEYLDALNIDKAQLYTIGKYCDEMVDDGFGGLEPRFVINTAIQTQAEAFKVVSDLTSVFRGMAYWSQGLVNFTQDRPGIPVMSFSPSNVIDGTFNYSGSSRKDRHSVVMVRWNDPQDSYRQKVEYVEDRLLVDKYGIRKVETVAFGCTSRGQANRAGLWILFTEQLETNVVSFVAGMDAQMLKPGDLVNIHDTFRAGRRMGGRIISATTDSVTLDAPVTLNESGATITLRKPNGELLERLVSNTAGQHTTINFVTIPAVDVPLKNSMFVIAEPGLKPLVARVFNIRQGSDENTFQIEAIEHNGSKFNAIESGLNIDFTSTSDYKFDQTRSGSEPKALRFDEEMYLLAPGTLGIKLVVSWEGSAPSYEVSYRSTLAGVASNWSTFETVNNVFEIKPAELGFTYEFKVTGVSGTGERTKTLVGIYAVDGTISPPDAPTDLVATGDFRAINLTWTNPPQIDISHVEIWEGTTNVRDDAVHIADAAGTRFSRRGLPALAKRYYWVKAINKRGMASQFNSALETFATTLQATHDDLVDQFVTESNLLPSLLAKLQNAEYNATTLSDYYQKADDVIVTVNGYSTRIQQVEDFVTEAQADGGTYVKRIEVDSIKNEAASAAVSQVNLAYLGPTGSIAQQITSLETKVDDSFAALQIDAQTIDGLKAQYSVKIDNNGYIAGFGLSSTSNGESGATSEFVVLADKFAIVQPSIGGTPAFPFVVTVQEDGTSKVSMNDAFITKITSAKLQSPDGKFKIDLENKFISIEV